MRKYYVRNEDRMDVVHKPSQAEFVLLEKEELDSIERKLQNQIEEVRRWRNKFSGDDLEYKLIKVDYIESENSIAYVTVSLPVAYRLEMKDQAKTIVESVFSTYINAHRRYKLHFAPLSGWSVNLLLTEKELDTFQLPN